MRLVLSGHTREKLSIRNSASGAASSATGTCRSCSFPCLPSCAARRNSASLMFAACADAMRAPPASLSRAASWIKRFSRSARGKAQLSDDLRRSQKHKQLLLIPYPY